MAKFDLKKKIGWEYLLSDLTIVLLHVSLGQNRSLVQFGQRKLNEELMAIKILWKPL